MQYQQFSTGDQVWFSDRYGKREVVKIVTNDGFTWEEGQEGMTKLTGAEKILHSITVAFIRLQFMLVNM